MSYEEEDDDNNRVSKVIFRTEEKQKPYDPLNRLAYPIFKLAIEDVFHYIDNPDPLLLIFYTDALDWIMNENEDFDFWCEKIGIEKKAIREAVQRGMKKENAEYRFSLIEAFGTDR